MDALVDPLLFHRLGKVLHGHNRGEALATLVSWACRLVVDANAAPDFDAARIVLAASLLSPPGAPVGSLEPQLAAALEHLTANHAAWLRKTGN